MNGEAALNQVGVETTLGMLTVALRNRMEVDRYVADEPAIDDAPHHRRRSSSPGCPVRAPPTSSTCSTRNRRCGCCAPGRVTARCRRRRSTPQSVQRRHDASVENARLAPRATGGKIDAFHLTDVDGPQECLAILDQTFVNPGILWTMSVGGYLDYLLHTADLQEAYEYHARVLKLLQWGSRNAGGPSSGRVTCSRSMPSPRCTPTRSSW